MIRPSIKQFNHACKFLKQYGVKPDDILNKRSIPLSRITTCDLPQGIQTSSGRIVLPQSIACVIVYSYDKELEHLMRSHLLKHHGKFNQKEYERDAIMIRNKYDDIEHYFFEHTCDN